MDNGTEIRAKIEENEKKSKILWIISQSDEIKILTVFNFTT